MSEVARRAEMLESLPKGLCPDRDRHDGHEYLSSSLGRFWCTGDPDDREPYRSERRRQTS
jgi:hypothetical protein